jgi:hypothetical protein
MCNSGLEKLSQVVCLPVVNIPISQCGAGAKPETDMTISSVEIGVALRKRLSPSLNATVQNSTIVTIRLSLIWQVWIHVESIQTNCQKTGFLAGNKPFIESLLAFGVGARASKEWPEEYYVSASSPRHCQHGIQSAICGLACHGCVTRRISARYDIVSRERPGASRISRQFPAQPF